jgi:cytochrome c553
MAAYGRSGASAALLLRLAGVLAGAIVLGLAIVYGSSEWILRRRHDVPLSPLRPPAPADPLRGEHMARIVGCWAGCHGERGEGGADTVEGIHRNTAPTLSEVLPLYSDEELARLVRYGVKRNGRSAAGMNAGVLWPLGDQDLADIFAHLRRQPASPPVPRSHELTIRGRIALVTGDWKLAADQVDPLAPRWGEMPLSTPFARGRYLASIVCSECHGADFKGSRLEGGPSLAILAIYGPEDFRRLLRTGKPIGGRDIPKMNWMPDVDFTDAEIDELYAFLRSHHGIE